jgi:protein-disulfide isomerase
MNKKLVLFLFFLTSCSITTPTIAPVKEKPSSSTEKIEVKTEPKVFIDDTYAYRGNKDAKNVMVEYFDFKCHLCQQSKSNVEKMLTTYPDKIKVVYKHYPFISEVSYELAYLFEAVSLENKTKALELYDYIFDHSSEITTIDAVKELGKKYTTKILTQEETEKIQERVKRDKAEAALFDIKGTPLFLMNDKVIMRGYSQESDFLSTVSKSIEKQ